MHRKKITFRTLRETAQTLCKHYNDADVSTALQQCVQDCLKKYALLTKKKRRITPAQTLEIVRKQKKLTPTDIRLSVRLPELTIHALQNYYNAKTITDTLHCCIYDVLNNVVLDLPLSGTDKVVYMLGQKNAGMQRLLNECFDDIRCTYHIDGYAEPFCGTANVLLHTAEMDREFLNDNSSDLINLLRVIQKYPYELRLNLLLTQLNLNTFEEFKETLKRSFTLKAKKSEKIARATAFYFVRYASVYGKGEYFRTNISVTGYHRRLDNLFPLSHRLQGVDIKKRDALYFTDTLSRRDDTLLVYCDAPYLFSEEHYKINNGKRTVFFSHVALRNKMEKLRSKHICLLSYRITASDSMKKKGIKDVDLQRKLDSLYLNRGYHFRLKQFDEKKKQIEILIATVPFCGSTPYSTSMTELEVEKYV